MAQWWLAWNWSNTVGQTWVFGSCVVKNCNCQPNLSCMRWGWHDASKKGKSSSSIIWEEKIKPVFNLMLRWGFSSVQSLSCVQLFATPWIVAHQASLSITNSWSLLKLMSIDQWCHPAISSSVVPFSYCPQSLPASGSFPLSQLFAWGGSIGVSASASVLPMNTQDWSPLQQTGWISLQSKGLSRVFSNTTVQKHQFFGAQLSSQSNSHIHTWPLEKPQPWPDGPLLAK